MSMHERVTENSFVHKTINVAGQRIRTMVRPGSSKLLPLLVFNGIGASLELVMPFVAALDPDLEVIAFDAPGVGESPTPFFPYRFDGLARTVAKMLDVLGYEQVSVIGVSWGGALAQQFAYDYPDRCKTLVLAATAMGMFMVPSSPSVLLKMSSPRRYLDPSYAEKIAPEIYGGMFRTHPELCKAIGERPKSVNGLGYYYQLWAGMYWTSIHWLHRLTQPTLILAGNDDPIIPLVNMHILARLIPDSTLHVVDDGHLFLVTQAPVVTPLITDFLKEHRA
jgi:poly(3-hydroxyalkanoate) depolymerase